MRKDSCARASSLVPGAMPAASRCGGGVSCLGLASQVCTGLFFFRNRVCKDEGLAAFMSGAESSLRMTLIKTELVLKAQLASDFVLVLQSSTAAPLGSPLVLLGVLLWAHLYSPPSPDSLGPEKRVWA